MQTIRWVKIPLRRLAIIPLLQVCAFAAFSISCAEEKNPYAEKVRRSALADGAGEQNPDPANPAGSPTPLAPSGSPELQAALKAICSEASLQDRFREEMAMVCTNGSASAALTKALADPYRGVGDPKTAKLRSVNANSVSELAFLGASEINAPLKDLIPRFSRLESGSMQIKPNADIDVKVSLSKLSSLAVSDPNVISKTENIFQVEAAVSGLAQPTRKHVLLTDVAPMNADKSIITRIASLKPGAPENGPNELNNSIVFYLAEGSKTKIFMICRTKADNLGFHAIVDTIGQSIAKVVAKDAFARLSQ